MIKMHLNSLNPPKPVDDIISALVELNDSYWNEKYRIQHSNITFTVVRWSPDAMEFISIGNFNDLSDAMKCAENLDETNRLNRHIEIHLANELGVELECPCLYLWVSGLDDYLEANKNNPLLQRRSGEIL